MIYRQIFIILYSLFLVTGCSSESNKPIPVLVPLKPVQDEDAEVIPVQQGEVNTEMENIRVQLRILFKTDKMLYQKFNNEFVKLSSDRNLYYGVRRDISAENKKALDALYAFRTTKLYYKTSWAVMDALSSGNEK